MSTISRELEARRREFCRPLDRDSAVDEPFFCELGTLWCTEGHGDWETAWYEHNVASQNQKEPS